MGQTSLEKNFRFLFFLCKILGFWPIGIGERDNVLDIFYGLPLHFLYWCLFFKLTGGLLVANKAIMLINEVFVQYSLYSDMFLVAYHIFARYKQKIVTEQLYGIEYKFLRGVKKVNLKIKLFLLIILGSMCIYAIIVYVLVTIYDSYFNWGLYLSYTFAVHFSILYVFMLHNISFAFRNIFRRINELILTLNRSRLNPNFIFSLLSVHYELCCVSDAQNAILGLPVLVYTGEFFLGTVTMAYYCISERQLLFGKNWPVTIVDTITCLILVVTLVVFSQAWGMVTNEVSF